MTDHITIGNIRLTDIRVAPHNIRRDLGDLRTLTNSIHRYGVMQPVIVERHPDFWRLRAGHRRVAAAQLAGLVKIPAVIHTNVLEVDEWIAASVQENVMRRELDQAERVAAARELRKLGCSYEGIADVFGVTRQAVQSWLNSESETSPAAPKRKRPSSVVARRHLADLIDDFRAREDATVADILDALDALLTPIEAVPEAA